MINNVFKISLHPCKELNPCKICFPIYIDKKGSNIRTLLSHLDDKKRNAILLLSYHTVFRSTFSQRHILFQTQATSALDWDSGTSLSDNNMHNHNDAIHPGTVSYHATLTNSNRFNWPESIRNLETPNHLKKSETDQNCTAGIHQTIANTRSEVCGKQVFSSFHMSQYRPQHEVNCWDMTRSETQRAFNFFLIEKPQHCPIQAPMHHQSVRSLNTPWLSAFDFEHRLAHGIFDVGAKSPSPPAVSESYAACLSAGLRLPSSRRIDLSPRAQLGKRKSAGPTAAARQSSAATAATPPPSSPTHPGPRHSPPR
jgi:hypothetical protein